MVGMGVPVVSSMVGGIAELVNESSGWPVQDSESVLEYVTQISSVLIQGDLAAQKAREGRKRFVQRHTWQAFYHRTRELGLCPGDEMQPDVATGHDDAPPNGKAPVLHLANRIPGRASRSTRR